MRGGGGQGTWKAQRRYKPGSRLGSTSGAGPGASSWPGPGVNFRPGAVAGSWPEAGSQAAGPNDQRARPQDFPKVVLTNQMRIT